MQDIEFWRMKTVTVKVGLSKTEIYRRVAAGTFPKPHSYPDAPRAQFWRSDEVRNWQTSVLEGMGAA